MVSGFVVSGLVVSGFSKFPKSSVPTEILVDASLDIVVLGGNEICVVSSSLLLMDVVSGKIEPLVVINCGSFVVMLIDGGCVAVIIAGCIGVDGSVFSSDIPKSGMLSVVEVTRGSDGGSVVVMLIDGGFIVVVIACSVCDFVVSSEISKSVVEVSIGSFVVSN